MARSFASGTVSILLVCALLLAPLAAVDAVISCSTVVSDLASCIPFARTGGQPSFACCSGLRTLVAQAATTADRRATCTCLKNLASSLPGLNEAYAAAIPGKCGVTSPVPIRFSVDCSKVQ